MTELSLLALGLVFGAVLGIFYFGGLWLTLRHLPNSRQPALLTLGSFLGRSLVCLFGFYLVSSSGLGVLIFGVVGFILAKVLLISRLGYGEAK
jgi:F1F0 ATPase subunit 2